MFEFFLHFFIAQVLFFILFFSFGFSSQSPFFLRFCKFNFWCMWACVLREIASLPPQHTYNSGLVVLAFSRFSCCCWCWTCVTAQFPSNINPYVHVLSPTKHQPRRHFEYNWKRWPVSENKWQQILSEKRS